MRQFKWLLLVSGLSLAACNTAPTPSVPFDWRTDWAIEDGFHIERDASGFHFPTAIAFVPHPGINPQDPLYFITEIAGRVKVVTNDRSVYLFADGFSQLSRGKELPDEAGQIGTAGICLEPERGHVFVTFFTQDDDAAYRNRIIRFETAPETFSIQPRSHTLLTIPFQNERLSRLGHHIDSCQIVADKIYVGIGDDFRSSQAQALDTVLGKIIRMTLDGLPAAQNPFRVDDDPGKPRNYVWASGFRNPFGLKIVNGDLFVADNGKNADRFVRVSQGGNYLWDGSDWSIGTNAAAVFTPSIAPAALDYIASGSFFPPDYSARFFLAGSSYAQGRKPEIVSLPYNFKERQMQSPPHYFLRYRGEGVQSIAALAFGTDGLYFAPLLPDRTGTTAVLRVTYDPAHAHPFTLSNETKILELMFDKGCFGCHALRGSQGSEGPQLDATVLLPRLEARLNSESYRERVGVLDQSDQEPYFRYRAARQEILSAQGNARSRLWITNFLQEPTFDDPNSRMPNLGLSPNQADSVADYLLRADENAALSAWYRVVPFLQDHLIVFFGASFVLGGICFALLSWIWKGRQHGT